MQFCFQLSRLDDERQSGRTYWLPTEAQWEYACRTGSSSQYSFGDDERMLGEYGWFGENPFHTSPVGQKKPNPWGLYDMHGNVWEWCSDFVFESGVVRDEEHLFRCEEDDSNKVLRGGSWIDSADDCRCSSRRTDPGGIYWWMGFRVVCYVR